MQTNSTNVFSSAPPSHSHSFACLETLVGTHSLLHFLAHIFSTPGSRQTLRCLLTATDHWSISLAGPQLAGGSALQAGPAWDKGLVAMIKTCITFQEILKEQRPKKLLYKEKYEIQCKSALNRRWSELRMMILGCKGETRHLTGT